MYKKLLQKIKSKKFSTSIIGLGYVGLPLFLRFRNKGIKVYGIDSDKTKVSNLIKGKSYISDIKNEKLRYFVDNPNFVSTNFSLIKKSDVIILCLPTPLDSKKNPDMSYIFKALNKALKYISSNKIIIIESTVYPGATRDIIKKIDLENLHIGKNFFISYSPERENPGDKKFSYKSTPKLVSGYTKRCSVLADNVYKHIVKKRIVTSSIEIAETSKLLENLYRSVNISLVNELKIICNKIGIDVYDVINAAATKNFGFQKFIPGPGMGGHCIPIDPYYLAWVSKKKGYLPKFIKTSGDLNSLMPNWIIKNIISFFKKNKIKFNNKKILLVGVSYKKNIGDDRESPFFSIVKELKKINIDFDYYDPFFSKINKGRNYNRDKYSIKLTKKKLQTYIATIIVTDHDQINYDIICKYSKYVFDTRFKLKSFSKKYNNIYFL